MGRSLRNCPVSLLGRASAWMALMVWLPAVAASPAVAAPLLFGQTLTHYAAATNPTELVFDSAGYLYTGHNANTGNFLQRVAPGGGPAASWGSRQVTDPDGLALLGSYVYASGEDEVVQVDRETGTVTQWAAVGGRNTTTITVDRSGDYGLSGDVFIGNARHTRDIEWIDAATRTPNTVVSSTDLYVVRGLTFAAGALYCVEASATRGIWHVASDGMLTRLADGGFNWSDPSDMAYHPDEDTFYVSEGNLGQIWRVPRTGGEPVKVGEGFGGIRGLTFGPDGRLYVSDEGNDVIWKGLPEPTSLALLAAGGIALLRRRRSPPASSGPRACQSSRGR